MPFSCITFCVDKTLCCFVIFSSILPMLFYYPEVIRRDIDISMRKCSYESLPECNLPSLFSYLTIVSFKYSSFTNCFIYFFCFFLLGCSIKDREERIKLLKEKQNEDRQRKLEELKQQVTLVLIFYFHYYFIKISSLFLEHSR